MQKLNNNLIVKNLMILFAVLGGVLSLLLAYQKWGILSSELTVTIALLIFGVSFFEFHLFKEKTYLTLYPVWVIGLGLLYNAGILLPVALGRGLALSLKHSPDIHPAYKWGKELIMYLAAFLALAYLTALAPNQPYMKLYATWIIIGLILTLAEYAGLALWQIIQTEFKINIQTILLSALSMLSGALLAPLLVITYQTKGAIYLITYMVTLHIIALSLLWALKAVNLINEKTFHMQLLDQMISSSSWDESLNETLKIIQNKLNAEYLTLVAVDERKGEWRQICGVGQGINVKDLLSAIEKMRWKELREAEEGGMAANLKKLLRLESEVTLSLLVLGKSLVGVLISFGNNLNKFMVEYLKGKLGSIMAIITQYTIMCANCEKLTTQVQDLKENLKQTKAQLIHSSKISTLGQIAAGVSHEINNPIGAILANAQFLEMNIQGDTEKECIENIVTAARRCRDITKKLLNYAREETLELSEVNINEVVENTISMLHYLFSNDKIHLKKELGSVPKVYGNFNELSQVLTNLLINAKDAILGRRLSVKDGLVQVRTRVAEDEYVVVEVKDNGIGMSEKVIGKVFHPFFTTKDVGKGTGMGLSICKGIIESHNGEITVNSKEGKGSTFTVKLPIAKCNGKGEQDGNSDFNSGR